MIVLLKEKTNNLRINQRQPHPLVEQATRTMQINTTTATVTTKILNLFIRFYL